jgi:hypothetical protein
MRLAVMGRPRILLGKIDEALDGGARRAARQPDARSIQIDAPSRTRKFRPHIGNIYHVFVFG